jgi:hypothetical protein
MLRHDKRLIRLFVPLFQKPKHQEQQATVAHLVPAALGRFNQPFNLAAGEVFSVAVPPPVFPVFRPFIILSRVYPVRCPETRMNRRGDFSGIYKKDHFIESGDGRGGFAGKRGELHRDYFVRLPQGFT